MQRSQQFLLAASESEGPQGALRCLSWLPPCLFALNLSGLWPFWQKRKRNCQTTLWKCVWMCVCYPGRRRHGTPSFRRHHDKTHLPAKTGGLVGAVLAQSGTKTAPLHLPLISLIFSLSSSPAFAPLLFSFIRPCAVFDSSPFFESRVIQLSLSLTLSQLNWWAFSTDYIKCILITLSTEICLILNFCIKSCLISIPPTPCTK